MKWAQSLIRISTFEVETLQKRLAEIVDLRVQVEVKMSLIDAEAEAEALRARTDAEAGWYLAGFREGVKLRVASFQAALDALAQEEAGARDALAQAFEELKKYEQVAENAKTAAAKETARRETAALDELGLRRLASRS